jgi:hypothetical protein
MEPSSNKCMRLQHELQQAYDAWVAASEWQARHPAPDGHPDGRIDVSGSPDAAKAQWFEYLAAKERLVLAFAEQPLAA